jgi:hypothetical protein
MVYRLRLPPSLLSQPTARERLPDGGAVTAVTPLSTPHQDEVVPVAASSPAPVSRGDGTNDAAPTRQVSVTGTSTATPGAEQKQAPGGRPRCIRCGRTDAVAMVVVDPLPGAMVQDEARYCGRCWAE